MAGTPGPGVRVGTAYVDIVPNLDKITNAKVLADVNKELQKAYTPDYNALNADQKRNQEIQAKSAQQAFAAVLKNNLDAQKAANKVQADADKQASSDRTKLAKAETAAYQEEYKRRAKIQGDAEKAYQDAIVRTRQIESDAANDRDKQTTKSEGLLHSLATQFRTIGTLARGLSVVSVGFLGFQALEKSIGAIQAALPVVSAGLVALPGVIAAAGVEAGILHIAFKNVGTAIKDGFDPTKVKQFNQEMSKLSPSARSFVNEILKLKDLKLPNLQQSLFGNSTLQSAGKGLAPTAQKLAPSTAGIASATGGALGTLLGGLETNQAVKNIKDLFSGMAQGIRNVTPGLSVLESGFLHLIGSDGLFGAKAGTSIGTFFTKVGDGLKKVNVAQVFHDGYVALQGFWGIAKNVEGTISGIVRAMGTAGSGAGFLGSLTAITKEFNTFANSRSGQAFLVQLLKSLNDLAHVVDTVVKSALQFLALAFAGLEPTIHAFANTIDQVFKDLVPLGSSVGTLAKAALDLANVLIKFLEPSLRLVVELIGKIPAPVLNGIATAFLAIYGAVKLLAIMKTLIAPALELAKAMFLVDSAMDANVIGLVVIGIAALAAGIIYLATKTRFFQTVWNGLEVAFKSVLKFLTTGFGQLTLLILGPLGALALLALHWKQAFDAMKSAYSSALSFFKSVGKDFQKFFTQTFPGWFVSAKGSILSAFDGIRQDTVNWWHDTLRFFTGNVPKFITETFPGYFKSGFNSVKNVFNDFKGFVAKIWTDVLNNLRSFGNNFGEMFTRLVKGVSSAFSGLGNAIEAPVKFVVNSIYNNGIKRFWNDIASPLHLPKLPNETFSDKPPPGAVGPTWHGLASGGQIPSYLGGSRQDNVYLRGQNGHPGINVSGGEYVVNAATVAKPGVLDFLNTLNFANPKVYVGGDQSAARVTDQNFASGGSVPAVLNFLKGIAGRVPYSLGAVGPSAYDCSGLVGEVWARLTGHPSYRRYFVTGTEQQFLLGHGFKKGATKGGFNVGLSSEHTVGQLAGHRFEAAHTGTKMRYDGGAANALSFPKVFSATGITGELLTGLLGKIAGLAHQATTYMGVPLQKLIGQIPYGSLSGSGFAGMQTKQASTVATGATNVVQKALSAAIAAAQAAASSGFGAGAALGNVGNGQIAKWIAEASKFANIPASWVPGIETIIKRESGGNPNAINRTDSNAAAGHPSQGLMQTIPSTFHRYHAAGTSNNILDPVANIAAAVNYIRATYGDISHVQQANPNLPPHGYKIGGPVLTRDRGGIIPTGLSNVFNGTGKSEYAFTSEQLAALRHDCNTQVFVDGVDVTSKTHVTKNNDALAGSLNRRSGR